MPKSLLPLKDGSKIAVIGSGPAGSFFAHFAIHLAREKNRDVSVTLFDGKNFINRGIRGCNMGAGIVAETLVEKMEKEGIFLPEGRLQSRINWYTLRTPNHTLVLAPPKGNSSIVTVFRGNGPRFSDLDGRISFDDFLLEHVKSLGAKVVSEPVREIILPSLSGDPVRLVTGRGEGLREFKADLVVGAFGLNTAMMKKVSGMGFGYRPPRTVSTCQMEIKLDSEYIKRHFKDTVVTFTLGMKRVRFSALVPKNNYLTFTLVGYEDLRENDMVELLNHPAIRAHLPPNWGPPERYCHCHPKLAISPSKHPFTDRFVVIGDASFCRFLKNGLESAFLTAKLAAWTAFESGVSDSAFKENYFKKARSLIIRDNFYGIFLFKVYDLICKRSLLTEVWIKGAGSERDPEKANPLRNIIWGMFTGDMSYRSIFFSSLNPLLHLRLVIKMFAVLFGRHLNPYLLIKRREKIG